MKGEDWPFAEIRAISWVPVPSVWLWVTVMCMLYCIYYRMMGHTSILGRHLTLAFSDRTLRQKRTTQAASTLKETKDGSSQKYAYIFKEHIVTVGLRTQTYSIDKRSLPPAPLRQFLKQQKRSIIISLSCYKNYLNSYAHSESAFLLS